MQWLLNRTAMQFYFYYKKTAMNAVSNSYLQLLSYHSHRYVNPLSQHQGDVLKELEACMYIVLA